MFTSTCFSWWFKQLVFLNRGSKQGTVTGNVQHYKVSWTDGCVYCTLLCILAVSFLIFIVYIALCIEPRMVPRYNSTSTKFDWDSLHPWYRYILYIHYCGLRGNSDLDSSKWDPLLYQALFHLGNQNQNLFIYLFILLIALGKCGIMIYELFKICFPSSPVFLEEKGQAAATATQKHTSSKTCLLVAECLVIFLFCNLSLFTIDQEECLYHILCGCCFA